MSRKTHIEIGIASILFAVFLYLVAIPHGVTAPSNIKNIVLSPLFWPQILAGVLAFAGIALCVNAFRLPRTEATPFLDGVPGAAIRLAAMAAIMVIYFLLISEIGMVWASMLAVGAVSFLLRTEHHVYSAVCAVVVPLILYAFFAHVAGVAVPQGEYVRLP